MSNRPADYPPLLPAGGFTSRPLAPDDERLEVGVLFVGGGPAGLAGAIRLAQKLQDSPELMESLGEVPIAVVDKGSTVGTHQLSGAVINPSVLRELLPDVPLEQLTSYGEVRKESVYVMTRKGKLRIPTPPPFHNKGNHVFSLSRLARALAERAEELGVMILPETAADVLLVEGDRVVGVRTGDKGRGREGEELANFEPGAELIAKVTVLSEGTAGHLTGALIKQFDLKTHNAQVWALGVKEVWKVAKPLDRVIHTMGWPLRTGAKYQEFGGSWIYPMGDDHISLGFVCGLDYRDASLSVHDLLQQFKTHPFIASLLEGGERVSWGAKSIPEGGWWALPKHLNVAGALIAGDSAGLVNVPKLKGVHYAMRSGMIAADVIHEQLVAGVDLGAPGALDAYDSRVREGEIGKDLYRSRNMKQPFHKGFFVGGAIVNLMEMTGGRFPGGEWKTHPDAEAAMFDSGRSYPTPDGKLTFDKLSSVFASGNQTRDDQPDHIRLQHEVSPIVAKTWVNMCPAAVYEVEEEPAAGAETVTVKVNPSNCVHCGAISAKGGRLTPPEGGSGPEYQQM